MGKLSWFKHYNTASEGQLIGDLIANKDYEAALMVYVIFEIISQFEDENQRGFCTVPINRIARRMNMKPSRIERVMGRISSVSHSDLICTMDEKQPRNASFLSRKWLEMQENRGGKTRPKIDQNSGEVRSKKGEERRKNNTPLPPKLEIAPDPARKLAEFDLEEVYKKYPRKLGKSQGMRKLKQTIKKPEDFEQLKKSVDSFSALMKKEMRAADKIPYFSTFANSWRDYLEVEQEDFSKTQIRFDHLR